MKRKNKINYSNKILLVDDDAIFRSEFKDCFSEYDIVEASNGEEALSILKKPNEIDLVILDIRMPGMSGLEVLKQIRKVDKNIKIIIFTGYGSKEIAIESLRHHVDDFLEKPFDVDETRSIIERVLERNVKFPDDAFDDLNNKIERVKRYIHRNLFKKFTLNNIAYNIGLSPKYLSRVFKEYVKIGFNEYKLLLKMEKAKELLTKTGYNIYQISYKLGYNNPESFIRQFKKHTKMTPSEYKKNKKWKKR